MILFSCHQDNGRPNSFWMNIDHWPFWDLYHPLQLSQSQGIWSSAVLPSLAAWTSPVCCPRWRRPWAAARRRPGWSQRSWPLACCWWGCLVGGLWDGEGSFGSALRLHSAHLDADDYCCRDWCEGKKIYNLSLSIFNKFWKFESTIANSGKRFFSPLFSGNKADLR